ncbi:lutropin-choriogonadotropic hormone receptor-like, partial [Stegodyphus dumicola]|uniref:lutropin-choriogonadotropic hormone receptor-like n=1 Tax=Stegodyphus dumicola TaxID=202533 RepID=UPI0015AFAEE9
MWSTTSCLRILFLLLLQASVDVDGMSSEVLFKEGEKNNFSMGFHHYRMGLRGYGAGHPVHGCKCQKDPVLPEEIVCACRGPGVKDFKANLTRGVTRLSLESVSMSVLRSGTLQIFRGSLKDLVLDRVKELTEIEDGAFYGLHMLRTISIKQAPKLKTIQDAVFNCHLPNLKIIRIIQSGLEAVPSLEHVETKSIIYMVDLDSNKINNLPTGSVKMKTEMLNLDFNLIGRIESHAFDGSEIAKLSLKGNSQLNSIHEDAFSGLKNVRTL